MDRRVRPFTDPRIRSPQIAVSARAIKTTQKYINPTHVGNVPNIYKTLPREAVVCVRRQQRKEVIFAIGKGGSRRNPKKYRTNADTKIQCRRK